MRVDFPRVSQKFFAIGNFGTSFRFDPTPRDPGRLSFPLLGRDGTARFLLLGRRLLVRRVAVRRVDKDADFGPAKLEPDLTPGRARRPCVLAVPLDQGEQARLGRRSQVRQGRVDRATQRRDRFERFGFRPLFTRGITRSDES